MYLEGGCEGQRGSMCSVSTEGWGHHGGRFLRRAVAFSRCACPGQFRRLGETACGMIKTIFPPVYPVSSIAPSKKVWRGGTDIVLSENAIHRAAEKRQVVHLDII